ncbi:hypothetical protein WCE37_13985 [Luteimonas sp. MJ250]|uniref:hypothetical protein n=1 Tax=Luteimonas sp. MJ250 TaxID=3129236 RepID=UPI0031B9D23A
MRRMIQSASILLFVLALAACAAAQPDGGTRPPPMSEPLPATPVARPAPTPPSAPTGVPDLDRSCRVDSDCEVKNVGNCCGYFPSCVNKDAEPDPAAAQAACAASGMAGVCGFRDIQACACVSNSCEPAASGGLIR